MAGWARPRFSAQGQQWNGGDDFAWMDSWQVYAKNRAAHAAGETSVAFAATHFWWVKPRAASALIYWNGEKYVWLQQGA